MYVEEENDIYHFHFHYKLRGANFLVRPSQAFAKTFLIYPPSPTNLWLHTSTGIKFRVCANIPFFAHSYIARKPFSQSRFHQLTFKSGGTLYIFL